MKDTSSQNLDALFSGPRPMTVTELNGRIKQYLEREFNTLLVQAEVFEFKIHASGHWYITLKDDQSQISAVFFRNQNRYQRFKPRNGLQVIVRAKINVYAVRGQYQLQIDSIEPVGVGALQLAFEEQYRRLQAEGLFKAERKRRLPIYPRRVGIVTSPTGAVIQDILRVLERRNPGLDIVIAPARVQGEGAAAEIANGIRRLNQLNESGQRPIDVLIVGRGGGAAEDLWAFNEEEVARAIYQSAIPVVSAVGHETDTTIADLVADLRAATPSAAAELVSTGTAELMIRVDELQSSLQASVRYLILKRQSQLHRLINSPGFNSTANIARNNLQRLERLMQNAAQSLTSRLQRVRFTIHNSQLALARLDLRRPLVEYSKRIAALDLLAQQSIKTRLNHHQMSFATIAGKLHALSPLAVLARGYTMTTDTASNIVTRARDVQPGQNLVVHYADGLIDCDVVSIKLKED